MPQRHAQPRLRVLFVWLLLWLSCSWALPLHTTYTCTKCFKVTRWIIWRDKENQYQPRRAASTVVLFEKHIGTPGSMDCCAHRYIDGRSDNGAMCNEKHCIGFILKYKLNFVFNLWINSLGYWCKHPENGWPTYVDNRYTAHTQNSTHMFRTLYYISA